jgi:hypothetical protein
MRLIAVAKFIAMFLFLTLFAQDVLRYAPPHMGRSYLPVWVGVGACAPPGVGGAVQCPSGLVVGALIVAGRVYLLSRVPVHC